MKHIIKYSSSFFFTLLLVSCSSNTKVDKVQAQDTELVFPKGEKITNANFTGTAWLQMLVNNDSTLNTSIGNVTFEPGARSNWHYHPGGQILLVTKGKGLYQEKGKAIEEIRAGDVVKCLPNVTHWHGATPTDTMTHIAIGPNAQKGSVVWLDSVTDEEYAK